MKVVNAFLESLRERKQALLRRVQASVYERARYHVRKTDVARLLRDQDLAGAWPDSYELLLTLATVRALLRVVPPVLIDIGAHRGQFVRAAQRVLGFERIVCIEPDVDLLAELEHAVPAEKTRIYDVALSDREAYAPLFVHCDRSMNSLVEADHEILREKFPTDRPELMRQQRVHTTTLDLLMAQEDYPKHVRFFLKLDTQGNELDILRAGKTTLGRTSACLVEHMFCSPYATSYTFQELVDFLYQHGLHCCGALNIIRRPTHEVSGVDFFFLRV